MEIVLTLLDDGRYLFNVSLLVIFLSCQLFGFLLNFLVGKLDLSELVFPGLAVCNLFLKKDCLLIRLLLGFLGVLSLLLDVLSLVDLVLLH